MVVAAVAFFFEPVSAAEAAGAVATTGVRATFPVGAICPAVSADVLADTSADGVDGVDGVTAATDGANPVAG